MSSVLAAQDGLKIVSHWTTNWDRGSTVTYIQGNKQRVDSYWGVREVTETSSPQNTDVSLCGSWWASYSRIGNEFYGQSRAWMKTDSESDALPKGPGLVKVVIESVDTGERLTKFGYAARHIVTTENFDLTQSSCAVKEKSHRYDEWYIDRPYSNKCSKSEYQRLTFHLNQISTCNDRVVVERKGPKLTGLTVENEEDIVTSNNLTIFSSDRIKSISREKLDPALFVRPANALPMEELRHRRGARHDWSQPNKNDPANPTPTTTPPASTSTNSQSPTPN